MIDSTQTTNNLRTIDAESSFEITIRRSRFIGKLAAVKTKDQAQQFLEQLRQEHFDAVHHCFAYRLGRSGLEYRMSDDGEPSGTAGKPILFTLQRAELTNVILVVIRYYGGTKLGVGPLARAYTECAQGCIAAATTVEIIRYEQLLVHCDYDDVSRMIELFQEVNAAYDPLYADSVQFSVSVDERQVAFVKEEIVERTAGRAGFSEVTAE